MIPVHYMAILNVVPATYCWKCIFKKRLVGYRFECNCPLVGPRTISGSPPWEVFLRDPVFTRVSEKTTDNSERLGRQARPGFEPGTPVLPVLSVTIPPVVGLFKKRIFIDLPCVDWLNGMHGLPDFCHNFIIHLSRIYFRIFYFAETHVESNELVHTLAAIPEWFV